MEFTVNIKKIAYVNARNNQTGDKQVHQFDKSELPSLSALKPMQRRRLSPYAKLAMHCALEVTENENNQLMSVFSSRHGDLHKTSDMLGDISAGEALSPTAFSLSVHNAVSGLFTIFTQNTQPSTTISAGKNTFLMAMLEAHIRLKTGEREDILLVHCDQALPEPYLKYADEAQIDHAIALVLTKDSSVATTSINLVQLDNKNMGVALKNKLNTELPQAIAFSQWFNQADKKELLLNDPYWLVTR